MKETAAEEELQTAEDDVTAITPMEDLDPDINTTVWLERKENHPHKSQDEQQIYQRPDEQWMQDQRLLHQENDGQAQIDPRQLFPQLNQEGDQHLPNYQEPDEQQVKDQRPLYQENDRQAQIDPMQLNP